MQTGKSPIYVFDTHTQAETAIQSLSKAGFDLKQLSLIGKGYHTEEQPIGFYSAGDRINAWGGVLMAHGSPEDATVARNTLSDYTTLDAA